MSKKDLDYKEVKLENDESHRFLMQLIVSILYSILILAVFIISSIILIEENLIYIIFIILVAYFFGIWLYYRHYKASKKKYVYTGLITKKHEQTIYRGIGTKSSVPYKVQLDFVDFNLPYKYYKLIQEGQEVEIYLLQNEVVDVKILKDSNLVVNNFNHAEDEMLKNKVLVSDTVVQLIHSFFEKSDPNSVLKTSYRSQQNYYYLQTPSVWIEINEELYCDLKLGDKVNVIYNSESSKSYSGIPIGVIKS